MIAHLQALIAQAKAEIQSCNQSITQINKMSGSLTIVVSSLGCVATALEKGVVINGVPVGVDSINAKKNDIGNYNESLIALKGDLQARISSLEAAIAAWEAEIARLEEEARRAAAASSGNSGSSSGSSSRKPSASMVSAGRALQSSGRWR